MEPVELLTGAVGRDYKDGSNFASVSLFIHKPDRNRNIGMLKAFVNWVDSSRSLRNNSLFVLSSNLIFALSQWGVISAIARMGGAEEVGAFGLGLAITAPIFLLFGMEIKRVIATDSKGEFSLSDYWSVLLLSTTTALALSMLVGLSYCLTENYFQGLIIVLVALMKSVESQGELLAGILSRGERMILSSSFRAARGVMSCACVTGVLWAGGGLEMALLLVVAFWAASTYLFDTQIVNLFVAETGIDGPRYLHLDFRRIRTVLHKTYSLGVSRSLTAISFNFPRYIIEARLGTAVLGHYIAVSYVVTASQMVVTAVLSAVSPRLARYFGQGDLDRYYSLYLRVSLLIVGVGLAMMLCIFFFGELILTVAYGPEFANQRILFLLLGGVSLCEYLQITLESAIDNTRNFSVRVKGVLLGILVVVPCSWLWVGQYGLYGAAYALMASKFAYSLFMVFALSAILREASIRQAEAKSL
jgi:O-antigen/teichoic acid export membrane protein